MSTPITAAHGRHRARRSRKRWIALVVAAVLLTVLGIGVAATWRLQSNLDTSPLDLGDQPAPEQEGPLDILVMGTDTREGEGNTAYGDEDDSDGLTDVMMLLHISEDRDDVSVVSFPRDLVADIPRCTDPDTGRVHPPEEDAMLNSAIENGGPGCTVAAINEITGVNIDHFMLADFDAVKELSATLGGVKVCVNEAVDDPKSGLELPAGVSTVEGEQALAFLRSRAAFGDGGDRSRIRSQQLFLASLARKIKEEGTLADLPQLYRIAEVASRNLHVDDELGSVPTMVGVATALRGIDLANMVFVTAPTEAYEPDPNRLQLEEDAAGELFEALREDLPLTEPAEETPTAPATAPSPSAAPSSPDGAPEAPAIDPAEVPVAVTNASGERGRGGEIADLLEDEGYDVDGRGAQRTELPGTQIFFGAGWAEAAAQVAAVLGVPSSQIVPTTDTTGVVVSVGQDFTEGEQLGLDAVLPEGLHGQTAAQFTCQEAAGDW